MISRFADKLRERMGNPSAVSAREIAGTVIRIFGGASEPVFEPLPEDDPNRGCPARR